jgi:hypothetical protein
MSKHEQFIKERRYLQNVSERTVQWYNELTEDLQKMHQQVSLLSG